MNPFIESHFEWIKTFEPCKNLEKLTELCDGILVAQILEKLSPTYFSNEWIKKLKQNPENWRLRVSNLKKILDKIIDFYDNILQVCPNIEIPDVNKIGKDEDLDHLSRFLQLVLGIVVNCENKQTYIENITNLDISVQQNLMEAIQQLIMNNDRNKLNDNSLNNHNTFNGQNNNLNSLTNNLFFNDSLNFEVSNFQKEIKDQLIKTMENLRVANEKKELILQQNHELMKKLVNEQNEKLVLQNEYEKLVEKCTMLEKKQDNNYYEETNMFNNKKIIKLQNKIEYLEKDLMISENQKEENLIKLELIEKEVLQLRLCNEELQHKVKETKYLQDELDVHRHSSDKIIKYEEKLDLYKKKFEEFADLKKEFKILEEKNQKLVATNLELEEELKKPSIFKQQIQDYKMQIQELHQGLIEKTHKCDRLEFDLEKQKEKINICNQEKIILEKEKSDLLSKLSLFEKINNHKYRDEVDSIMNFNSQLTLEEDEVEDKLKNCLGFEINEYSNELKEKLVRSEHENKLLKERLEETNQEAVLLLRMSYEDAKSRSEELEKNNRKQNRKIIELESRLNDLVNEKNNCNGETQNTSKLTDLEEQLKLKAKAIDVFKDKIYSLEQKITKLNGDLSKKDDEFNEMDAKYKKYVQKAKQVASLLEPISHNFSSFNSNSLSPNSSVSLCNNMNQIKNIYNNNQFCDNKLNGLSVNNNQNNLIINGQKEDIYSTTNIDILKMAIFERDKKINELLLESERERNLSEMETRLITVAFHNIFFNLTRKAATDRVFHNSGLSNNKMNKSENSAINQLTTNLNGHASFLSKQRQVAARKNI